MIERAEWLVRADEPKSPLGLFVGKDLARGVPISWSVFLCAFLYGVERGVLDHLLSKQWASWIGFASGFGFLLFFGVLVHPLGQRVPAPDPTLVPSQRVNLMISLGGRSTGEDAGVLTFVDGWLHFEGARTSFSLRYPDVQAIARKNAERTLTLAEGQTVTIKPFYGHREAFMRAFEGWGEQSTPDGRSRFPPRKPHRTARASFAGPLQAFSAFLPGLAFGLMATNVLWGTAYRYATPLALWVVGVSVVLSLFARLLVWERVRSSVQAAEPTALRVGDRSGRNLDAKK